MAALFVGSSIWLGLLVHGQHVRNSEREAALAAARRIATDYVTYDYQKIDAQFARLATELTGPLAADFLTKRSSVAAVIKSGQGKATGQVVEAAVTFQAGSRVAVIAVVDQAVVNTVQPNGNLRRYRFAMVMSKRKGRWYASALAPV